MDNSNSLIKRLIVLASSVFLFYIFLKTKFLVDNTQDITSDVILIMIVVVVYMMFVKYVKKQNLITEKYINTENGNWHWKLTLIFFGLLANLCLNSKFNSNTENQKLVEKQNQHLDMYTQLVHDCLNAGIIEEICFRGLIFIFIFSIFNYFFNKRKQQNDWLSLISFVLVSSCIFGIIHVINGGDWNNISIYFISGLIFSVMFILSKDIKTCMICHALINAFPIFIHTHLNYIEPLTYIVLGVVSFCYVVRNYRKWL
ncbi:membrane protease YdiL (CAAX protease family) [Staphylococcus epidermidis]|uniref:CPBP family intramembrane glutamic endopeptidase n=1 Tax=Staphylococcus epidermidis TaxID=1282 RepID=UPI0019341ECD|nr:CPBP family intramembrane glutamic endopeptidase [Staphylococcus epidermidis]MBM0778809.1 CPBP family intramembrane metalloprotease [Staphylococcus epidermidis]